MGAAGNAAKGLLWQAQDPRLLRGYIGQWSKEQIVTGAGSKNIPMLRWAHDMVEADRRNDMKMLDKGFIALNGYLDATMKFGHFLGEEYSTIYWRWIVIPMQIVLEIAQKREWNHLLDRGDKWLQDFITINVLGAWPTMSFKQGEHSKKEGVIITGIPTSSIGMARAWVMNKGDDGRRDVNDSMSWLNATSHAPWLAWMLGKFTIKQLAGGDNWVKKVLQGFHKQYSFVSPLSLNTLEELSDAVFNGVFPTSAFKALTYGPSKPMMIGRTTLGTWTVGEDSFTDGSTSFMHVKMFDAKSRKYDVESIANPLKRSNRDPGQAIVSPDFREVVLKATDNTIWDWEKERELPGQVTVDLPRGDLLWVVRITKDTRMQLYPLVTTPTPPVTPPPSSGKDEDDEPWYKRLWRKIIDWF